MRSRLFRRKPDLFILKNVLLPIAVIVALVFVLSQAVDTLGAKSETEQLEAAKRALSRAAVQCYALEGRYPPNIDYLRENYGLNIDTDIYIIHYIAFASNIMPDIDVLPINISDSTREADLLELNDDFA